MSDCDFSNRLFAMEDGLVARDQGETKAGLANR